MVAVKLLLDLLDLRLATHKARQLERKVVFEGVQRPESREIVRKVDVVQLVHAFGLGEIPETVLTNVLDARSGRQVTPNKGFCGSRHHDLAAVCDGP